MQSARTFVLASVAAIGIVSPSFAQNYKLRLVARTGDAAPGSIGGSFTWLGWPTINASGQVAFAAGCDGLIAETGLWRSIFDDPQHVELIIGQDYPVPGSPPEVRFGEFEPSLHHPLLNDSGNVGFSASLINLPGSADPLTGLFRMINGSIERVAVPGDVAPGTLGTATYKTVSNLPSFNESNSLAFNGQIGGRNVGPSNDRAIFAHWLGGVQMVVREGNGVPGMPGTTFAVGHLDLPTLEDNGRLGFNAALLGASAKAWSRWLGWPGLLDMVVAAGDPTPLGGVFTNSVPDFWCMSTSSSVAGFRQGFNDATGPHIGLWSDGPSGLKSYAAAGEPGPLGFYSEFSLGEVIVAGDGTAAFEARFTGFGIPTTKDTALLRSSTNGPATVLVREDDAAEGWGSGVVFDDLLLLASSLPINDDYQIVFSARVRGAGITPANDTGLWVADADGSLHSILRKGQLLGFGGAPKQVSGWTVTTGVGVHSGRRPGLNQRGDVAIVINFTDDTDAVVVAQRIPACAADLNGDGQIDASDLALLLGGWGVTGPVGEGGDVDWDGDTDGADLALLLGAWGPCGSGG